MNRLFQIDPFVNLRQKILSFSNLFCLRVSTETESESMQLMCLSALVDAQQTIAVRSLFAHARHNNRKVIFSERYKNERSTSGVSNTRTVKCIFRNVNFFSVRTNNSQLNDATLVIKSFD